MTEHRKIRELSCIKPGKLIRFDGKPCLVVKSTATEHRILAQSTKERREIGAIEKEGGEERVIVFGRPSMIPTVLFKIGIKKLGLQQGETLSISHAHWESDADPRPSQKDVQCAGELQDQFPDLSLRFRVVAGRPNRPLAYQYYPPIREESS